MSYTKTNWQNTPSTQTPISAANLNHMEQGIFDAAQTADSAQSGVDGLDPRMDLVEQRLDNLIPQGTPTQGNAELIDIRVGANGVTYPTAGDAVRGQVTQLKSALTEYPYTLEWTDGGYIQSASGVVASLSGFSYTENYYYARPFNKIKWKAYANANMGLSFYARDYRFISSRDAGNITDGDVVTIDVPQGAYFFRLTSKTANKTDTTVIAVNDIADIEKKNYGNADKNDLGQNTYEWEDGKYVNYLGTLSTLSGYSATEKINVMPKESVSIWTRISANYCICFYDANDQVLTAFTTGSGYAKYDFIAPDKAAYFRASCVTNDKYRFGVEFGTLKEVVKNISNHVTALENSFSTTVNPLATIKDEYGLLGIFHHVGIVGDSLASGESASNEGGSVAYHDLYAYSWGQCLARATGNTYYNFSQGGMTAKGWMSAWYGTATDGNHDCELYIIALGVNDKNASYGIGTISDINDADYTQNADSFYGHYGKIIQALKAHSPKAKFMLIGIPNNPTAFASYNAAISAIASHFDDCYYMDLYTYGKDLFGNGTIISQGLRSGHYNAFSYYLISNVIGTYAEWIIRNNASDFSQVEFIGTEWSWNT